MFGLKPPRDISTLPIAPVGQCPRRVRFTSDRSRIGALQRIDVECQLRKSMGSSPGAIEPVPRVAYAFINRDEPRQKTSSAVEGKWRLSTHFIRQERPPA